MTAGKGRIVDNVVKPHFIIEKNNVPTPMTGPDGRGDAGGGGDNGGGDGGAGGGLLGGGDGWREASLVRFNKTAPPSVTTSFRPSLHSHA